MKLVIQNNIVIAYHENDQNIDGLYPNCTVITDNNWFGKVGDEYEITPEIRQADFESKFLTTSLGNYRLEPKGYANAQQSIDTVNAIVNYSNGLTEEVSSMVLFYETPDFTKAEECTEEWLVQHQYSAQPMTLQKWAEFYVEFTTLYARKMYQQQIQAKGV